MRFVPALGSPDRRLGPHLRSRLSVRLGLMVVAALVGLGLAELLLRHGVHAAPLLDLDLYTTDAHGNLRYRPGVERRHVTRQWDVAIRTDADGFRDRDVPVVSARRPILALGDSFSVGWGVALEQSYLYLTEERLGQTAPVRIVKAGVNGTGTCDQLLLLETVGESYRPQLVLLSLFVGNDFTDVQMGGTAQFEVSDGLLVRRDLATVPPWKRHAQRVMRSSHLLQFLRATQFAFERRGAVGANPGGNPALAARDPWLREFVNIHLKEWPAETARGVAGTLACLDRIADWSVAHDARFVVMVIPRSWQVYPEEMREVETSYALAQSDMDPDHPQRALAAWATERGIAMLDLLAVFRDRARTESGGKLYYYPDAHLNVAGHRVTAEALEEFVAPLMLTGGTR